MQIKKTYIYLVQLIAILLVSCQNILGQELYTVSPLNFNTKDYDELAACPYKGGLVFCSNRKQSVFIAQLDSLNLPLLDLYFVQKKDNQKWGTPELFSPELTTRFHEGFVTFNKKGDFIYFTRGDKDGATIYTAQLVGGKWDKIEVFPFHETNANEAHPCLSADGRKLFFVSNKHGGYGGFDIYVSVMGKNRWGQPKNLGSQINSQADELYPFYHENGKLYFASNRKGGFGRLDIYYSKEQNGQWTTPVLMPAPINSKFDDCAFTSDSIDRMGYFSSDRNSRFKQTDIFEFSMNFPVINTPDCLPQKINKYTYEFTEQSAVNNDSTTFIYEWDFGDGIKMKGKALSVKHKFKGPGDYLVQLNVIDTITNTVQLNQASNIFPVRDIEQPFITCSDSAEVGKEVIFNADKTYLPEKKIINYYWDFSDNDLSIGKEVKHTFLQPGIYKIYLGVTYQDSENSQATIVRYKTVIITTAKTP